MAEIRVEHLTKTFGTLHAVDDVSFTFPSGQVTCLLGPSGCGKTTLMRIIAGLEKQTPGASISAIATSRSSRRASAISAWSSNTRSSIAASRVYRNIELPLQSMKLSTPSAGDASSRPSR